MNNKTNRFLFSMFVILVIGQVIAYLSAPDSWTSFMTVLPKVISMITFWGPIIAIIAFTFVSFGLRMMGFNSLEDIRRESVEENNPAPAIIFVGTLIASILFLMVVIKP